LTLESSLAYVSEFEVNILEVEVGRRRTKSY